MARGRAFRLNRHVCMRANLNRSDMQGKNIAASWATIRGAIASHHVIIGLDGHGIAVVAAPLNR